MTSTTKLARTMIAAIVREIPIINKASTELVRVEQVGNYAIQLFWKDGHSFGIYSWSFLRELCPREREEA